MTRRSRRSRRASSGPQRVGSDEGLTSTGPRQGDERADVRAARPDATGKEDAAGAASARPDPAVVEQTTDDTDEGWGERGDDDASARWLRENRPPHWS